MTRQKIEVWVDEEDLARIDQVRGLAARSAWARDILHGAISDHPIHHGVPSTSGSRTGRATEALAGKHLHRYVDTGETRRAAKGVTETLGRCECGEERWA